MPEALSAEYIALQQAVVGRYSLERELGRGGMGIVFLARDVALDRPVAIKLLPPAMAAQPTLRERFLREAQLAAKLSHPNIIPIFSVEQAGGLVFFVMAYVEGETLGQRLKAKGPLNPRDATKLLQEVAWALAYAHLRGIVHRDVKPDNILLEASTGRALVSDFGIARSVDAAGGSGGGTAVGEVLGTAQYMSPEQACGEPVDGRSDLYSLGVVGFLALSGRLPFDAPDIPALLAQQITKPPPPLSSVQPGAPRHLASAIDRCLAKDPAQRFQTGEQLGEALAAETAITRQVPAPVRVWLMRGHGAEAILVGWSILMSMGTAGAIAQRLAGGGGDVVGDLVVMIVPWLVYLLYRGVQTQRLVAAGFDYEDLRQSLRQYLDQRREELTFEYDRAPSIPGRVIRWLSFAGLASVVTGGIYTMTTTSPSVAITAWLMGAGSAVAVGGALIGLMIPGRRRKARDWMLEWRMRLMDSRFGRLLFRALSTGARPVGITAGIHRPTEVAIGMASLALFEALDKETRKQLKDLPLVIRKLEADAAATRARVDELSAMLAGPVDSGTSGSQSLAQGGAAADRIAENQAKLKAELTAQRDAAAKRMAAAVAALENVRLDLLRLTAGVGTVDELSADLAAARDLQRDIDVAIQSQDEVRALLAPKS